MTPSPPPRRCSTLGWSSSTAWRPSASSTQSWSTQLQDRSRQLFCQLFRDHVDRRARREQRFHEVTEVDPVGHGRRRGKGQ